MTQDVIKTVNQSPKSKDIKAKPKEDQLEKLINKIQSRKILKFKICLIKINSILTNGWMSIGLCIVVKTTVYNKSIKQFKISLTSYLFLKTSTMNSKNDKKKNKKILTMMSNRLFQFYKKICSIMFIMRLSKSLRTNVFL